MPSVQGHSGAFPIFTLLDYVSRAHEIEIRSSSVRPSSILVVAPPGSYSSDIYIFIFLS